MIASLDLYLLRHAHAGDPARSSGPDEARRLSELGRRQAERIAAHLAALGTAVDAVVASPKVRAIETARPIADRLGLTIRADERLAARLTPTVVEAIVAEAGDPAAILLVGHEPDLSELLTQLTGLDRSVMAAGTLVRIASGRPVAAGSGVLRWLIPPDALAG